MLLLHFQFIGTQHFLSEQDIEEATDALTDPLLGSPNVTRQSKCALM